MDNLIKILAVTSIAIAGTMISWYFNIIFLTGVLFIVSLLLLIIAIMKAAYEAVQSEDLQTHHVIILNENEVLRKMKVSNPCPECKYETTSEE
jgi:hypothetical protein